MAKSRTAADPIAALQSEIAMLKREISALKRQLSSAGKGGKDPRVNKLVEALIPHFPAVTIKELKNLL